MLLREPPDQQHLVAVFICIDSDQDKKVVQCLFIVCNLVFIKQGDYPIVQLAVWAGLSLETKDIRHGVRVPSHGSR